MVDLDYSLHKKFNSNSNNTNNRYVKDLLNNTSTSTGIRVISIILDETHWRFEELGGWSALGVIEYDFINNPSNNNSEEFIYPIAYPINSNVKNFPLINEIVYLTPIPGILGETKKKQYYNNIVGIWNHPHHNAYPFDDTINNTLSDDMSNDYTLNEKGGLIRKVTDNSTSIYLGKTFEECLDIHPLLPLEGDVIHEGRWGNSLRFSSTVPSYYNFRDFGNLENNWSETGESGDPITILRNGQGSQSPEGWIPITEDINNDDSSIYLTSTQEIKLEASSQNYESYTNQLNIPDPINKYNKSQILLNSGRLVFNSTKDHILLSSKNSINLNAVNSVNIDAFSFIVDANQIHLGNARLAIEPLVLGKRTVDFLQSLLTIIQKLNDALKDASTPPCVVGVPGTLTDVNAAALYVAEDIIALQKQLEDNYIISDTSFTQK